MDDYTSTHVQIHTTWSFGMVTEMEEGLGDVDEGDDGGDDGDRLRGLQDRNSG